MLPPRTYTFIGLNAVRILSMIGLILVFSSSIVVMVHDVEAYNRFMSGGSNNDLDGDYIAGSTIPNQPAGVFWAILNRLLIIFQVIVLFMSECGWPMAFFNRFFPILGNEFGTGALGTIECLIGAAVLSHHVDTFSLVSAFFLFSLGCVNILVGLIWRQHAKAKDKRSVTTWRNKTKELLPTSVTSFRPQVSGPIAGVFSEKFAEASASYDRSDTPNSFASKASLGFGRQGEKAAALKGFLISKPVESLPRYAPKPTVTEEHEHEEEA